MKCLLFLLTVCMFSFNGNANQLSLYTGYTFGTNFEFGGDYYWSGDGDANGSFSIGINYVMEFNKLINYGAFLEYAFETESDDSDYIASFVKLGALGTVSLFADIYLIGSLGVAIPSTTPASIYDNTDPSIGLVYGAGIGYNMSDEFSVEVGYSITSFSDTITYGDDDINIDVDVSSIILTGVYRL